MNLTTTSGDRAYFSCTATAQPRPTITWLRKGGVNIPLTANNTRYAIHEVEVGENEVTSTLVVLEVEVDDAGVYICRAEVDSPFPATEDSALLTVGETPTLLVLSLP